MPEAEDLVLNLGHLFEGLPEWPAVRHTPAGVSRSWKTVADAPPVEIVSPSSARGDRLVKRRPYQRQRVATYWIVDPDARLVEVWHPDDERPAIVTDALRWRGTPEADALEIDLEKLFAGLPE